MSKVVRFGEYNKQKKE